MLGKYRSNSRHARRELPAPLRHPSTKPHAGRRSASVRIPRLERREWRRSRINRAAHDLPPGWAGRPQSQPALRRTASEPGPAGRWAAHLHSEAGRGRAQARVTAPTGKPQPRSWQATAGGGGVQNRRFLRQPHSPAARQLAVSRTRVRNQCCRPSSMAGFCDRASMSHLLDYAGPHTTQHQPSRLAASAPLEPHSTLHCWSFSRSFHRPQLNRTRPDSPESSPNLTWLDPTGP
jgi:hypothetical protein